MINVGIKKNLEKQGYRVVGSHSAVKVCGWTKNSILGKGTCYKHKFYGIKSNQCLQMSTSLSCANRCVFCWRDYKSPVSKEWVWSVDEPELILEESKKAHYKLLIGFFGNDKVDKVALEESRVIRHAALSLTGEPINYPKINKLVEQMHEQRISTFVVTNGQNPESIDNLSRVTQLYLSLDGPDVETLKETGKPLFKDYWDRLNRSLVSLSKKKFRTCIRITLIRGLNDFDEEGYASLIAKGSPGFIEVKAYMFIGASKSRLKRSNMPSHEQVLEFSKKLEGVLSDYVIISDHKPSRVVLLAHKRFFRKDKWFVWINFDKFFKGLTNYDAVIPEENLLEG